MERFDAGLLWHWFNYSRGKCFSAFAQESLRVGLMVLCMLLPSLDAPELSGEKTKCLAHSIIDDCVE